MDRRGALAHLVRHLSLGASCLARVVWREFANRAAGSQVPTHPHPPTGRMACQFSSLPHDLVPLVLDAVSEHDMRSLAVV
eukprot:339522-Prymnesium_polylepis.1